MSGAGRFAEFLGRIGHRTAELGPVHAYDKGPGAWLAFPFHREVRADGPMREALAGRRAIALLRYCEPPDGAGVDSARISCTDTAYDLPSLASKSRRQARRGLERCEVREQAVRELEEPGFALFASTLERQGRRAPRGARRAWARYFAAAEATGGFRAWGAWADDRLVAYLLGFPMDRCFSYLRNASDSRYLDRYPNNALVLTATRELMRSGDFAEVSYGLAPLTGDLPSLDAFKRNMGYEARPIRQNVIWSPRYRALLGPTGLAVRAARRALPGRAAPAQAAALVAIARRGTRDGALM